MKNGHAISRLILGILFILGCTGVFTGAAATNTADLAALVEGNNAFAFDLYAALAKEEGNLFLSPYSISSALGLAYAGARGRTAAEMEKTLHFGLPGARLHQAFSDLGRTFNARGKSYRLSVANAMWAQAGMKIFPEYLAIADRCYEAGFKEVDYARQTELARQTINRWVEEKTEKKIVELIKPQILDTLTRLVLTNAIYFKGQWESRFDPKQTSKAPFHLADGKEAEVQMMHRTGRFGYAESEEAQVLELPYSGGELAMVVVLPKPQTGLPALEASLGAASFQSMLAGMAPKQVEVFLPRFKLEKEFSLGETLQKMGMRDAFNMNRADFSGISEVFLYITHVLHKAFVEVNEEGTEAAAATAVVMGTKSAADRPAVFRADRPFFFALRDLRTGSILFMGRVADPRS